MCKKLQTINAETLLVKNQDNPEYLDVILNGKETLESAFADIKHPEIIRKMKDAK